MRRMFSSLLAVVGLVIVAVAQGQSHAANLTTLVSFCTLANCVDGRSPSAGLIIDAKANLFGTTSGGGANDFSGGTVFEIAKTTGGYASTPTTLVSFCSLPDCADGADPVAGLTADAKGNLFGATAGGGVTQFFGANGGGTVFEIAKTTGGYASTPTTLVSFCSLPDCADGAVPAGPALIVDANGNLFGTTVGGGRGALSGGTVFEIRKTRHGYASTPTTLVSFCLLPEPMGLCADGASPFGLIADTNGNLFGTTNTGGPGTVFEIVKTASGYASTATILVSFCSLANCADGFSPTGNLIMDANGNLFGTTAFGGANNNPTGTAPGAGTVFEIVKTASGYASTPTTLVNFCSLPNCADGANPEAGLIIDADGNLFGTTEFGGASGLGTVFKIAKTAGGYASTPTTLVSFCSLANCADGSRPVAGLVADANGNLVGTTQAGGAGGNGGTVFEVTGSGFVVPHKFAGTPGKPNCFGQSVSALARQYGGLNAAAEALGYPSVRALQDAILDFCEPEHAAEHEKPEHQQRAQLD